MSLYEDGAPLDPPNLRAVGFIGRDAPFTKGEVTREFAIALAALGVDPWQPFAVAGRHPCDLCRFSGGPGAVGIRGHEVRVGNANLFVPDGELCWFGPSTIVHYIDAHEYRPPDAFIAAVLACPPMRSMDYLQALRVAGVSLGTRVRF